ncbi:cutinase family protein [Gordonia soli]|uniref:Putative cutinase n=1 Tax=Gordonia soli NBRC 108243 TaxID=1223545 RepID=M0QMG7_9ACTN|nr:cutinase family protein [Gordonia soli]GAC69614.1 putative cutinase [Gordonia soli NBRC 108243]
MIKRLFVVLAGTAMLAAGSAFSVTQHAEAAPGCPDVEAIFARGTVEPGAPLGLTGAAFGEALRNQLPSKSVNVRAVNYEASANFNNRLAFAHSVIDGIEDVQARVKSVAAKCAKTKIVLGGYSQGAAVVGYSASDGIKALGQYARYQADVPPALSADLSRRIAAVVLFAPPSDRFLRDGGAPALRVSPKVANRTVRYCIPGDNICNGAPLAQPNGLHVLYTVNGDALRAAQYVKARV